MSKGASTSCNKQQQEVMLKVGKKSEAYFTREREADQEKVEAFAKTNAKVATLTPRSTAPGATSRSKAPGRSSRARLRRRDAHRRGGGGEMASNSEAPASGGRRFRVAAGALDRAIRAVTAAVHDSRQRRRRLIAAAVVLVSRVVVRYMLHSPTDWQDRLVIFLIVGATFSGAPYGRGQAGMSSIEAVAIYVGRRNHFRLFSSIMSCSSVRSSGVEELRVPARGLGRRPALRPRPGGRRCGSPTGDAAWPRRADPAILVDSWSSHPARAAHGRGPDVEGLDQGGRNMNPTSQGASTGSPRSRDHVTGMPIAFALGAVAARSWLFSCPRRRSIR